MKDKHKQMYMRMAEAAAITSSARRLQVGAIAVKNNMVIGTGYNGLPSGVDGECEYTIWEEDEEVWEQFLNEYTYFTPDVGRYRLATKPEVRHAESNLLLNLSKSTESSVGSIIFCTHSCCIYCAMDIVDAGVKKVYYKHTYRSDEGLEYLKANNVEVEQI